MKDSLVSKIWVSIILFTWPLVPAFGQSPTFSAEYPITHTNVMTLYGGSGGLLGSSPTFSVVAQGTSPLSYQWRTNGVAVGGATSASFTFTNAQVDGPTNFDCVVTNTSGSITSMVWRVAYVPAPTASFPQSVLALHPMAYWRMNEPDNGLSDGNPGALCMDYASGNNGYYTNVYLGITPGYSASTDPSETAVQFGTYTTTGSFATGFGDNIDFGTPAGSNAEFSVAAWVNGQNFSQDFACGFLTIGLYSQEQFTVAEVPATIFAVVNASGVAANAFSSTDLSTDSNWHYMVGVCDESNGVVSVYIDGQLQGTAAITPGSGLRARTSPLMIGARYYTTMSSVLQYRGNMNDVAFYNYPLTAQQVGAGYAETVNVAPYFTQKPANTNINAGGGLPLTIPVEVVGTGPIGYSWDDVGGGTNRGDEHHQWVIP